MDFVNKLDFSDQKHQTNGNLRYEHCKRNFLFPMKDSFSFGKDHQSM